MYTNLTVHLALSETMIQHFRAECFKIINPSLYTRIPLIELPDPASYVAKIDEISLDKVIEKLGGAGDILVLIDYDNLFVPPVFWICSVLMETNLRSNFALKHTKQLRSISATQTGKRFLSLQLE